MRAGFPKCRVLLAEMLLLLALGCNRQPANIAAAFPASDEVAGWSRTSGIRTYEAADLWKYIDGEAEKYLSAGVQRASTADYKFQNNLEAVVDIYAMSKADGATKLFDSEPAADAKSVDLGDAARLFRQSLLFRKGSQLVRIVAYQDSPGAPEALLALGRGVAQRLPK